MFMNMKAVTALILAGAMASGGMAVSQDADSSLGEALMALDGSATDAGIDVATGWHTCDVIRAGAGWGNHYVALTCPNGPFVNKWHILSGAQKDAMLATALAAATSAKRVQVNIGVIPGVYNEIRALYWHN